jgi:hypothetical protein
VHSTESYKRVKDTALPGKNCKSTGSKATFQYNTGIVSIQKVGRCPVNARLDQNIILIPKDCQRNREPVNSRKDISVIDSVHWSGILIGVLKSLFLVLPRSGLSIVREQSLLLSTTHSFSQRNVFQSIYHYDPNRCRTSNGMGWFRPKMPPRDRGSG